MAIIQLFVTLLSRSLGRVLSTMFGWAVVALFGETTATKKLWLSALVGVAAAWPLLVVGIFLPKTAAMILAFVPVTNSVPAWIVRAVWIVLALAIPLVVGLTMAVQRPTRTTRESRLVRMARGFPISIGVAAAFLVLFATVPVLRIISLARRRIDLHVPIVTDADSYEAVANEIVRRLAGHGFEVEAAPPPWWMTAPSRILLLVDRTSFSAYIPRQFAYYRGEKLEAALYPNGLLLRGTEQDTAWAHGVVAEALTATPGLQTFDPAAQDIERQIRHVWRVYRQRPDAHRNSTVLLARLTEIGDEIRRLPVPFEEWQIVYRQALQLGRALRGEPQLLEASDNSVEVTMNPQVRQEATMASPTARAQAARAEHLSTRQLISDITGKVSLLVKKEVELATAEVKADLQRELTMVKMIGAGAITGLLGLNLLLVAVVFALTPVMPGWVAALLVGGVVLLIAGVLLAMGWSRRVTAPLAMTRKTLKEDVQWAKERVA